MTRRSYRSDQSDRDSQLLEPLLPPPMPGGGSIKYHRREVANAIRYVLRTGRAWRMLPYYLPPCRTALHLLPHLATGRDLGTVDVALRGRARVAKGRDESLSAAIIDSQSVKTTEKRDLVAMMLVRESVEENGTSSLTRWDECWPW